MASEQVESSNATMSVNEESSGAFSVTSFGSGSIQTEESGPRGSLARQNAKIDHFRGRYPHCIVWSPITVITWFIPIFGHVGIAYTNGKIRDFCDAFVVADDRMTYGKPTKYLVMNPRLAVDKEDGWDEAIEIAAEEYTIHDHDTCCDNSYSMVAVALNLMRYKNSRSWNMFWVFFYILVYSKYVGCCEALKTWGPFLLLVVVASILCLPFAFGPKNTFATSRALLNDVPMNVSFFSNSTTVSPVEVGVLNDIEIEGP